MSKTASRITVDSMCLPLGWRQIRLNEVCEKRTGIRNPHTEPAKQFKYIDISSVDNVAKRIIEPKTLFGKDAPSRARQIIREGDVLVSTTRPNLNAVALVPPELDDEVCSTGFCVLRANHELSADYLFAFVQSKGFIQPLSDLVKGALYPAVTASQVLAQSIPLPPLPEQRRIAAILKEQMAAVERARAAAEAQLKAARELPAAYLRAVFNDIAALGWQFVKVGDISSLIIDGPHVTPMYVPKGVPFVTVKNIVNRRVDLSRVSYITESDHAEFTRRGKAEKGDILYTKDGTLGVPCVVDIDDEFSFFVSVALIKLIRERADSRFVAYALESPLVLKQVELLGAGAGLKHMVLRSIRALEIPLPPMPEQRKIATALNEQMLNAEQTKKILKDQLDSINKLPAALLRQAFTGKL